MTLSIWYSRDHLLRGFVKPPKRLMVCRKGELGNCVRDRKREPFCPCEKPHVEGEACQDPCLLGGSLRCDPVENVVLVQDEKPLP